MFFTRVATLIASIALVLGVFRIGAAFYSINVAQSDVARARSYLAAFLGDTTTAQAINEASVVVAVALVVGVLTEISRSVHASRLVAERD